MGRQSPPKKKGCLHPIFYNKFPTYTEILTYLETLAEKHPSKVDLEIIGKSYEGRPIYMIIIQLNKKCPKDCVMIEAGIHAREWLTNTTALYVITEVLRHQHFLRLMDFLVIPCLNPDGYEYSHTKNRLWRKNMNPNNSNNINNWGVDLNRNFPYGYGLAGSSSVPSSVMYRGCYKLSEPETQSLDYTINKYRERIKLYISLHAYGHLIMYPWGFTSKPIADERDLRRCANCAKKAMKSKFPRSKFRVGPLSKAMYIASGTSVDYVRGHYCIKFVYTMELHKFGKHGFTPPPSKILCVGEEVMIGLECMLKYVYHYYNVKQKYTYGHKIKQLYSLNSESLSLSPSSTYIIRKL